MSDARKLQATYERFVAQFMVPLLGGHVVHVERPIGPGVMPHFALATLSDTALESALSSALEVRRAEFAPRIAVTSMDRDALALAVSGYNLAALADSSLSTWPATRARPVIATWIHTLNDSVSLPRTEAAAVVRHLVVERVLTLWRRDVVMSNWGTTQEFRGRKAPRTPTLPPVAFERVETRVSLFEVLDALPVELAIGDELQRYLASSPITEILHWKKRGAISMSVASLGVLSSVRIRSAIARELARAPMSELGPVLWAALAKAHQGGANNLAPLVALIVETQLVSILSGQTLDAVTTPEGARFWAVFPLLCSAREGEGRILELSTRDTANVAAFAARLSRELPRAVYDDVRSVIAQSLSKPLSHTLLEIQS